MLILPKITGNLPTSNIDTKKWSIPKNIKLADSRYFKPEKIDLLIGTDSYWEIMCTENYKLHTMGPWADRPFLAYWAILKRGPHMKKKTLASTLLGQLHYLPHQNKTLYLQQNTFF